MPGPPNWNGLAKDEVAPPPPPCSADAGSDVALAPSQWQGCSPLHSQSW